jgi:hypothetical protein
MTMSGERRIAAVSLTAAVVTLASLGLASTASALPAGEAAGPVAPSRTTVGPGPGPTRTVRPIINGQGLMVKNYVYKFTLNSFRITDTRSLHNDTDFVSIAVAVGSNPPVTLPTVSMGDLNNGTYQVNASIPNIAVAPGDKVAFTYAIVNTGYDKNTVEQDLSKAVACAANNAAGKAGGAAGDYIGIGDTAGTAIGTAAGGWLIGKLDAIIFANCDGTVAAGDHAFTGAQLNQLVGAKTVSTEDNNPGTDSPTGCGRNSHYYVTWSVTGTPITPVMSRSAP